MYKGFKFNKYEGFKIYNIFLKDRILMPITMIFIFFKNDIKL